MKIRKKTDQELFWAGKFGREYSSRNMGNTILSGNTVLFSRILAKTGGIGSVIEFGANIGMNLLALRRLLPAASFSAVEINPFAAKTLKRNIPEAKVYCQSLLDFEVGKKFQFVLAKGVLIHQNPDSLPAVYNLLYNSASRYICIAEYYNPSPVQVNYRGHSDRLFKRDFAGEMMARYKDLSLVDYGFAYHGDPMCSLDDITWFLIEKRKDLPKRPPNISATVRH